MSDVETRPRRSGSRPTTNYQETADPDGGRLLWGRLAVAGFALLFAFVLGRWSVDEGVPRAEFDQAAQRVQELQERNALLSAELAAAKAGEEGGTASSDTATGQAAGDATQPSSAAATGEGAAAEESTASGDETSTASGETYVVEPGDTLGAIAAEVYGDSSQYERIAEANGIDSETDLKVGAELVIPPAPDAD